MKKQFWHRQGCPLFDVHPAFRPHSKVPLMNGLGEYTICRGKLERHDSLPQRVDSVLTIRPQRATPESIHGGLCVCVCVLTAHLGRTCLALPCYGVLCRSATGSGSKGYGEVASLLNTQSADWKPESLTNLSLVPRPNPVRRVY